MRRSHQRGYVSASTQARRAQIPAGRRGGIDANVSNLSVASFPDQQPDELVVEQVRMTQELQRAAEKAARSARARQRALDRSRRNTNADQYGPSPRQATRASRRAGRGLAAKQFTNPGGARRARADGVPLRGYRHDTLSARYRRIRSDHAAAARAASRAKQSRAHDIAAQIVANHGTTIIVEDCRISTWARLWGKRIAVFSPGMLVAALKRECHAAGGQLHRAGTHQTALSQHCLCGARVPKTLAQRTHAGPHCGLRADRDIASAMLAACVRLTDPDDPRTALVDFKLAHALQAWLASQQELGGLSQPAPAPSNTRCRIGQDRQPPPGGGLC